jgi:hypothetical protein
MKMIVVILAVFYSGISSASPIFQDSIPEAKKPCFFWICKGAGGYFQHSLGGINGISFEYNGNLFSGEYISTEQFWGEGRLKIASVLYGRSTSSRFYRFSGSAGIGYGENYRPGDRLIRYKALTVPLTCELVFIPFRFMALGGRLRANIDDKQVLLGMFLTAHIGILARKKPPREPENF